MAAMLPQVVLPWLLGVCAYALHKVISSRALRRAAAAAARKKDESIEEEPDDAPANSTLSDSEPDAEPEAEEYEASGPRRHPEDNIPSGPRRKQIWVFLVFVGGAAATTLCICHGLVHTPPTTSTLPGNLAQVDPHAEVPAPALEAPVLVSPQDMLQDLSTLVVEKIEAGPREVEPQPMDAAPALTITLTRQGSDTDSPDDFIRSAYYGTLEIGNPPVKFTVVFDTGSGHLIVPSTYCPSTTCREHKRFRPKASRTCKEINRNGAEVFRGEARDQIAVGFGTGQVTGVFVEDVVCVGGMHTSGPSRGNETQQPDDQTPSGCLTMRVIAATEMSDDPFLDFQFDGILGLGLDGLSQSPEFNFITMVSRQAAGTGLEVPRMFAVFLADSDSEDSEIAMGGFASHHLREDLSWTPVFEPDMGHWLVNIRSIRVDNVLLEFCADGCRAAVDTGTSLLVVPTAIFPELYEQLRSPAPLAGHCASIGPQLHIEFDTFTVTLGPKEYATPEATNEVDEPEFPEPPPQAATNESSAAAVSEKSLPGRTRSDLRCVPMLMTLELPAPLGPKLFVLGEPVLRKYYTVYDAHTKQVGFGRAKHARVTRREHMIMDDGWKGMAAVFGSKATPTMFDVFRWRQERKWTLS